MASSELFSERIIGPGGVGGLGIEPEAFYVCILLVEEGFLDTTWFSFLMALSKACMHASVYVCRILFRVCLYLRLYLHLYLYRFWHLHPSQCTLILYFSNFPVTYLLLAR